MPDHVSALDTIAASAEAGHMDMGHQSVTGTATITTRLKGTVLNAMATVQAPSGTTLSGFVAGCVPSGTDNTFVVTVFDKAGTQATAAAIVHWTASDA